jgi:hypothetical protein
VLGFGALLHSVHTPPMAPTTDEETCAAVHESLAPPPDALQSSHQR